MSPSVPAMQLGGLFAHPSDPAPLPKPSKRRRKNESQPTLLVEDADAPQATADDVVHATKLPTAPTADIRIKESEVAARLAEIAEKYEERQADPRAWM